jgi:hypothetical protein
MFLTVAQMSSRVRAFLNWLKEVMTCSLNVPYLGADVIKGEGLLELVEGGDDMFPECSLPWRRCHQG